MIERWIKSTQKKDRYKILTFSNDYFINYYLQEINADFYILTDPTRDNFLMPPRSFYIYPNNNIYPGDFDFILAFDLEQLPVANYVKGVTKSPIIFFPQKKCFEENGMLKKDINSDLNVWRSYNELKMAQELGLENNATITYCTEPYLFNTSVTKDHVLKLINNDQNSYLIKLKDINIKSTYLEGVDNIIPPPYDLITRNERIEKSYCLISLDDYINQDIIDSMACGCIPIIPMSKDTIINHGINGFYYEYGNMEQLIKFCNILYENENIRNEMSKAAIETVKNFEIEKFINTWNELLKMIG